MVHETDKSKMNIRIGNYCLKTLCECGGFDKLSVVKRLINIKEDKLPPFHKGCDCVIETNKTVRIDKLQKISDQVCKHFKMSQIPVFINRRLRTTLGLYYGNKISLNINSGTFILLHELAHHLHWHRFEKRVTGYYKSEMWPSMEFSHIKDGKKWYAATGELKPEYFRIGTTHGKQFQKCFRDIQEL